MKFSIITPSYNSSATIEKAVESVLKQNYKNFEHIVVDGASNDGTVDILKRYPHLKLVVEPDNGQADAMRKGFQLASGEIIGNLNSDDYYKPDAFENVLSHFESGEDFVMGKVEVISEHNQTNWINNPAFEFEKIIKHWELNAFCVNPVGYFYRRKVQEKVPFNLENDDKHDLEFLMEVAFRYKIKKIDVVIGVFSHLTKTKTFREQIRPSYWRSENFNFLEKYIKQMDEHSHKRYLLERQRGYQLRRNWSIQEATRIGKEGELIKANEFIFLPADAEDSLKSRCGFVEFDRIASKEDWIISVLTMGQVASKSICQALKNIPKEILPAQIYHIHSVNDKAAEYSLPSRLPYSTEAAVGLALNQLFLKKGDLLKWKFLTGIRDPIAAAISSAFENKIPVNQLKNVVIDFARYITFDYFNLNYKDPFGINILDCSFDYKKGYTIIKKHNIEVLIYRFEDLPDIFSVAIDEYFGISGIKLAQLNISSPKKYTKQYKNFKNTFSLEKNILDEIYSTDIVKKFYSEEEIEGLYRKWEKKNRKIQKSPKFHGLIYDIGLHTGEDTEFYLKKGFKVIAVDANPKLVDDAKIKFSKYIADKRLILLNIGIVEQPTKKKLEFYINENQTEWSSFVKEIAIRGGGPYKCVKVNCATLKEIIGHHGKPYFVKIDIEGHDHFALKSLLSIQNLPKYISVENGNMGMLDLLYNAGYCFFKYIQQNNIQGVPLPSPHREGNWADYTFSFGSSGPFGEETIGEWKTYEDVRSDIAKVWDPDGDLKNPEHDDSIHGWFDLHARLF